MMANTLAIRRAPHVRLDSTAYLATAWIVSAFFVNPIGNFPLNDDWSFGIAVQRLLATGEFHPTGWTGMPLLTHVLWGSLFCIPFGFSYTVLRISTLFAGLLGIVVLARLLRACGCREHQTTFALTVFAFNPLYFNLSYTFMTDVTFTALSLLAIWLFCRYLQTSRQFYLHGTLAVTIAALLMRQIALFVPIAMTITLLAARRDRGRPRLTTALWLSIALSLACVVILWGFEKWLTVRGVLPALYHAKEGVALQNLLAPRLLLATVARSSFNAATYLGWFLCPLLIWRLPSLVRRHVGTKRGRIVLLSSAFAVVAGIVGLLGTHHPMPLGWNVIQPYGIGPHNTRDSLVVPLSATPRAPLLLWQVITAMTVLGAVTLLLDVASIARRLFRKVLDREIDAATQVRIFLLSGAIVYTAPLIVGGFFDRYLLIPFVLLLALFALDGDSGLRAPGRANPNPPGLRASRLAAWLAILVTAGFSIAATHDYLGWNRARWDLINQLLASGVSAGSIDGGLEMNGVYGYDPAYVAKPGKSWYWVRDDRFVIALMPLTGYHVLSSEPIGGWLPNYRSNVLLLVRDGE
jgi:hypothetical protein